MVRVIHQAIAVAVVAAFTASGVAADNMLKVKEGDAFPAVSLTAAQIEKAKKDAKEISISDLKGKIVVIFFYPKANTPGCTIESCGFRDIAEKFPKDTVLLGASADDMKAQEKFIADHKLPYALLCDTDQKLIKELGISAGKVPQRKTFVIGKDGKIAKIYDKVTPKDHPAEVLKFVEEVAGQLEIARCSSGCPSASRVGRAKSVPETVRRF